MYFSFYDRAHILPNSTRCVTAFNVLRFLFRNVKHRERNVLIDSCQLTHYKYGGFLELKELPFFKRKVSNPSRFNFENFITASQANEHNLQHEVVYCYNMKLVALERSVFSRTCNFADSLARKTVSKIKLLHFCLEKRQKHCVELFFPGRIYNVFFQLLKMLCSAKCFAKSSLFLLLVHHSRNSFLSARRNFVGSSTDFPKD